MSNAPRAARKRTRARGASAPSAATRRKREVLGLILCAVALLLALSVVTYSSQDDTLAQTFTLGSAFDSDLNYAQNALGQVGATLAYALVPQFLGFPVLLLIGLIAAWGYVILRHRTPIFLPLVTGLTIAGTIIIACLFGWIALHGEADLRLWSGAVGEGTAAWLSRVFGSAGSLILLIVSAAVTILLLVDRDIQWTLDRFEAAVLGLKSGLSDGWFTYREASAERRATRHAVLDQRRAERDAAREAKSADKPERPAIEPPAEKVLEPKPTPQALLTAHNEEEAPPASDVPLDESEAVVTWNEALAPSPHGGPALHVHGPIEEETVSSLDHQRESAEARSLPFSFPPIDLLDEPDPRKKVDLDEIEENKRILLDKLETYNIAISAIDAVVGPTVTRYELTPAPGIKISRITALEDDLAMALAAPGIRIIAPIPGKSAIGVEIPNRSRELVRLRSLIATARFRDSEMELPIPIGKSIEGETFIEDLAKMPHVLMAGATGAGKSVGLNDLIIGLLYKRTPNDLKFVMIDPKKIELNMYSGLHKHYVAMPEGTDDPIITDFSHAAGTLRSCETEMEQRYDLLAMAGVRSIKEYNAKFADGDLNTEDGHKHLPYIVVVIDELADLMMTAGKEIEPPIARLAQMARAVGIHLVLATQRPSVDVITGLIKANFPARIAYQVASRIDSRTIIDQGGAQQLVGNGDLLYMNGSRMVRLQGAYVSSEEEQRIVDHIEEQPGPGPYWLPKLAGEGLPGSVTYGGDTEGRDDLFEDAARIIVRSQQGSVSLLQRKLSVGYSRAAKLVDQLEDAGVVGPFVGSKARDVLVEDEAHLDRHLHGGDGVTTG